MAQRDLYDVLGVQNDASQEDIKRAFRKLARQYHPDVSTEPDAEQRFKEINLAYETLSDPARRRQYDLYGGEGFTPDMFGFMGDMGDLFEAFFGAPFGARTGTARRRSRTERGGDLRVLLELTFDEAAFGVEKEIDIETLEACGRCSGNGCEPGTSPSRCRDCGGSGQVSDVRRSVFGTVMTARPCPRCEGTGQEIASPCRECRGDGRLPRPQTMSVKVPAGVSDGMDLRVEGGGEDGRQGGFAGDLYITLRVEPHPVFERHGQDLLAVLELPVSLAMLGGEVEVETLEGPAPLRIPPGTRAGTVLRLKGAGVPHIGRRGRGDVLVRVDLEIPEKLSRKERAAVEELARLQGVADASVRGRLRRPS